MTGLRFALTALEEISWFFSTDTFMRVSDVADAFPNLPLHPDVWPFFFFRFFGAPDSTRSTCTSTRARISGRPGRRAPSTSSMCAVFARWRARSRF